MPDQKLMGYFKFDEADLQANRQVYYLKGKKVTC